MPGMDGSGPMGSGPRTGWGLGRCDPNSQQISSQEQIIDGQNQPYGRFYGRGAGFGRGFGRGRGRGFGRGMGARGRLGVGPFNAPPTNPPK